MDRLDVEKEHLEIDTFGHIPALLIGHLATDARYERHGVGSLMVAWATMYAHALSRLVGCRVVLVSSEPDVVGFYERFGFKKFNTISTNTDVDSTIDMYLDIKRADI